MLIHERLDFDRSVQGTQPIVRLARRCPPHRRRLRRHLGQLVDLFQPVNYAIKFQSLGSIAHDPAHACPVKMGGVLDATRGRLGTLNNFS